MTKTMDYLVSKEVIKRTQDIPLISVSDRGLRFNTLASRLLALEKGETKISIKFNGPGKVFLSLDPKNGFQVFAYRITRKDKEYNYGIVYIKNKALKALQNCLGTKDKIIRLELGEFREGSWPLIHIKK